MRPLEFSRDLRYVNVSNLHPNEENPRRARNNIGCEYSIFSYTSARVSDVVLIAGYLDIADPFLYQ